MKNDWQTVPLSSVLTQDTNYITELEPREYAKLSVKLYGRGVELDAPTNGATVKMKRHQLAQAGQVIVSEIWAKKGAIGIVPSEGEGALVTSHFFLFNILSSKLERRYVDWLLRGNYFAERLEAQAFGTTGYAATRPKQFLSLEVNLPPLPEQQRIVARIEELARRVEEAQGLRKTAVEESNNLVNVHLSAIVRDLETKYETPSLDKLLIEAGYGTSVKCESERINGATPVLRIPNVASEKVTFTDLKYGFLNQAELKKTMVHEGDLLIVRTNGSKDLVGRCAVVPTLSETTSFASYMIRIRCNSEKIAPHFLQLILRQQRTAGQLIDFARTTAGQYNVSLGRLRNTKIPLPPLPDQHRIVAYLDSLQQKVDELRRLQAATQTELDALMPSILAKAFAGEL